MHRFLYNYIVITKFSQPVTSHTLMLRCQPISCNMQRPVEEHLVLPRGFHMQQGIDAYGNRILYGGMQDSHSTLAYVSTGIMEQDEYIIPDTTPAPWYGTLFCKRPLESAKEICSETNGMLEYKTGVTDLTTKVEEVLAKRQGVCQDFANVMIHLCRKKGIPARYVNGFIVGEGKTHAWVEVHDGHTWHAFDPTHNTHIRLGYIKLAHGRSALDCTVDRGMFKGITQQQTTVNVSLVQL